MAFPRGSLRSNLTCRDMQLLLVQPERPLRGGRHHVRKQDPLRKPFGQSELLRPRRIYEWSGSHRCVPLVLELAVPQRPPIFSSRPLLSGIYARKKIFAEEEITFDYAYVQEPDGPIWSLPSFPEGPDEEIRSDGEQGAEETAARRS
eukprot:scaffold1616_cov310-Pinguiococcus_pyrenoidosus.AAC.9